MTSPLAAGSSSSPAPASHALETLEPRCLLAAAGGVSVAAGDLNGDGRADLAIIHRDLAARNVLLSLHVNAGADDAGRRRFDRTASVDLTVEEFQRIAGVAIGDVNGDGAPDVIVAVDSFGERVQAGVNNAAGAVASGVGLRILAGDGKGGLAVGPDGAPLAPQVIELPPGTNPAALAIGDLDGDGLDDIAILDAGAAARRPPTLLLTWGTGLAFKEPQVVPLPPAAGLDALYAADVDGDGFDDLVAADAEGDLLDARRPHPNVVTILGAADRTRVGTMSSAQSNPLYEDRPREVGNPLAGSTRLAGLGDLDGDGDAELLAWRGGRRNGALCAADFDPKSGRWKAPELNANSDTLALDPDAFAVRDLDGDGLADVLALARDPGRPWLGAWSYSTTSRAADGTSKLVWSPRTNVDL